MNLIIRNATIIDSKSSFHNQIVDVKISNGKMEQMGKQLQNPDKYQEIKIENLHL